MTTHPSTLSGRIAQAITTERTPTAITTDKWAHRYAAAILPLVQAEVRKAQAEALRETADWWAANPDDDAFETDRDTRNWLRDVAAEYESGDSDEHR